MIIKNQANFTFYFSAWGLEFKQTSLLLMQHLYKYHLHIVEVVA